MSVYAAAEIEFVDRESGEKTVYCYPVTKVTLHERDNPDRGMVFVARADGTWQQVIEAT